MQSRATYVGVLILVGFIASCGEDIKTGPGGGGSGAGGSPSTGGEAAGAGSQQGGGGGAPSNLCVLDESTLDNCLLQ